MNKYIINNILILSCILLLYIVFKILLLYIVFKKTREGFEEIKCAVLLTTCIKPAVESFQSDETTRKKQYEESITKWMDKTNLIVYVVESSNRGFPELEEKYKHTNRLHIIKYDQTKVSCNHNSGVCRTYYEAYSMKYALEQMKYYDYILKVTGRYYLDGVEKDLNNILHGDMMDGYFQIHQRENHQNSEYFLLRKDLFITLTETILSNTDRETDIEHFLGEFKQNISHGTIGPYKNNIPRGGDGIVIDPL